MQEQKKREKGKKNGEQTHKEKTKVQSERGQAGLENKTWEATKKKEKT